MSDTEAAFMAAAKGQAVRVLPRSRGGVDQIRKSDLDMVATFRTFIPMQFVIDGVVQPGFRLTAIENAVAVAHRVGLRAGRDPGAHRRTLAVVQRKTAMWIKRLTERLSGLADDAMVTVVDAHG